MNIKDKDEIYDIFAKGFHEIVPPLLEDAMKDVASKGDIDRLERKIDASYERADRHGKRLENHEKRIGRLEVNFLRQAA